MFGGIEAGGTKWVCALGDSEGKLVETARFATGSPEATLSQAISFFEERVPVDAVGVVAFGPLDLRSGSPTYGHLISTPKPGWSGTDVVSPFARALRVPIAVDTDVNGAALGEWSAIKRDRPRTLAYVTVGTGVGGGVVIDGTPLHGLLHPEFGHMRIPHDRDRDPFEGSCPFHGDCLEGLASGVALEARWGQRPDQLGDPLAWDLEAEYLGLGLMNLICALSPQQIVLGGGVSKHPGLLTATQERLHRLAAGYFQAAELLTAGGVAAYVVAPRLGDYSGVSGAIELARAVVR
jgi:fructokinase